MRPRAASADRGAAGAAAGPGREGAGSPETRGSCPEAATHPWLEARGPRAARDKPLGGRCRRAGPGWGSRRDLRPGDGRVPGLGRTPLETDRSRRARRRHTRAGDARLDAMPSCGPSRLPLAETFVRGDGTTRARLAAEALTSAADPAQVKQLRQALRLMESRAVNLALAGRPTPFSAMSLEARERYLLSWARLTSRAAPVGVPGARKLLTFLAYAEPGAGRPEPAARRDRLRAGPAAGHARPRGDRAARAPGPGRRDRPPTRGHARRRRRRRRFRGRRRRRGRRAGRGRPLGRRPRSRVRSSTNRRCRPTSSTPSTGCTWTAASSRPGTAR